MADESAAEGQTATSDRVSFTPMEAAAKLQELNTTAADALAEPVAEDTGPVETPEVVEAKATAGTSDTADNGEDWEHNWADLADTSDDIETTEGSDSPDFSLTLKRKGEERTVTDRSEATRLAQMGLDYDTRSSELANERREFEAFQTNARETYERELAEVRKSREALAERLSKFTQNLTPPDPELAETDPDAYVAQLAKYQAQQAEAEKAAADLDRQNTEDREKRAARVNQAMQAHQQPLQARVPATKQQATLDSMGKYMVEGMGFTMKELVQDQRIHPADSRLLEMAYKSMKYDEARLKAKQKRAEPNKTTSTGRSGKRGQGSSNAKQAFAKAKKSGTVKDAVAALAEMRREAS